MITILVGAACGILGFIVGAIEENIRYSIIANEANKGDEKCQAIMNEFSVVGKMIEDKMSK